MVIRAIAKVTDSYKKSRHSQHKFRKYGAFPYDSRLLSWDMEARTVSIWTLSGRQQIGFVCPRNDWELLQGEWGEAKLCLQQGRFYLHVACEIPEPEPIAVEHVLGIDLGLDNGGKGRYLPFPLRKMHSIFPIATDSDGDRYRGKRVIGIRERRYRQRKRMQAIGSKSARRVLKRLSGREQRFMRAVNHQISKQLVEKAKRTGRGLALEDLSGIRERVRVSRRQRRRLHGWAFHQLGEMVKYKARKFGLPVFEVDPAYTSQRCSQCGHVSRSNRQTQEAFECVACGFSAHADHNAAVNVSSAAGLLINQAHAGAA
jgi:putative transposase